MFPSNFTKETPKNYQEIGYIWIYMKPELDVPKSTKQKKQKKTKNWLYMDICCIPHKITCLVKNNI